MYWYSTLSNPEDPKLLHTTFSHSLIHAHIHRLIMASYDVAKAVLGHTDKKPHSLQLEWKVKCISKWFHSNITHKCLYATFIWKIKHTYYTIRQYNLDKVKQNIHANSIINIFCTFLPVNGWLWHKTAHETPQMIIHSQTQWHMSTKRSRKNKKSTFALSIKNTPLNYLRI